MNVPPKTTRLEVWKITFARSSFIEVSEACSAMLRLAPSTPKVIISALSTSALVLYARPFKQNSEVKLDKSLVPSEFTEFHEDIVLYRDRVVAQRR